MIDNYNLEKYCTFSLTQYESFTKETEKKEKDRLAEKHFQTLNFIKELLQTELVGLNEPKKIAEIKKAVDIQTQLIKKTIIWFKNNESSSDQLNDFQLLKRDFKSLAKQIDEKAQILQKKESLYKTQNSTSNSSFLNKIETLAQITPHLKKNYEHLMHVLKVHMRLDHKSALTQNDLTKLKTFRSIISTNDEELIALIDNEIAILDQTFLNKIILLKNFSDRISSSSKSFQKWSTEEKISFYVEMQQILCNPFEPPIDPLDLLEFAQKSNHHPSLYSLCESIRSELSNPPNSTHENNFWRLSRDSNKKHTYLRMQTKERNIYTKLI